MSKSFTEALLKAGLIRPEDTPETQQEERWRERQKQEAAEVAARMAEPPPQTRWEPPAPGKIVDSARPEAPAQTVVCTECGDPFDKSSMEHKPYGRSDQCGPCARGEEPGPTRKRGQMVWTHKTAPVLEIEGGPKLSPEELAAMRRR